MIYILNKETVQTPGNCPCSTTFCPFPIKCIILGNLSYFKMSTTDISIKFHLLFTGLSIVPFLSFFFLMSPVLQPFIDMSGNFFCYKFPAVYTSLQN